MKYKNNLAYSVNHPQTVDLKKGFICKLDHFKSVNISLISMKRPSLHNM